MQASSGGALVGPYIALESLSHGLRRGLKTEAGFALVCGEFQRDVAGAGRYAGAKARNNLRVSTAALKSCPFTMRESLELDDGAGRAW